MMKRRIKCLITILLFLVTYVTSSSPFLRLIEKNLKQLEGTRNSSVIRFDELNELLSQTTIHVPDEEFSILPPSLSSYKSLRIKNLECGQFAIEDLAYEMQEDNDKQASISFTVRGVGARCQFKWELVPIISFLSQSGEGKLNIANSSLKLKVILQSPEGFDTRPPASVAIRDCETSFDLENLDLTGSLPIDLLEALAEFVVGSFSGQIFDQACITAKDIGSACGTEEVLHIKNLLEPYFDDISLNGVDPLTLERNVQVESGSTLVDLKNNSSKITSWINYLVDQISSFMSIIKVDPMDGKEDLGINIFLRKHFLDDDNKEFRFDFSEPLRLANTQTFINEYGDFSCSALPIDPVQLYTNIDVSLETIKVKGLDSFDLFEPLSTIGKYTLRSHVELKELEIEVGVILHMQELVMPKDQGNLLGISLPERVENIIVKTGMNDIKSITSILAALDLESQSKFKVGSFLHSQCVLRYVQTGIAQLEFSAGEYKPTTVAGIFNSDEIDSLVTDLIELGTDVLYQSVMESALPNMVGTDLREAINDELRSKLEMFSQSDCKEYETIPSSPTFVNFHSLLSSETPNQDSVYGDIIPSFIKFFNENLVIPDSQSGLPVLNTFLLNSFTTGRVYGCETSVLTDLIKFSIANVRIENMDSLGNDPLELLQTTSEKPHEIGNGLIVGSNGEPLVLRINLSLAYDVYGLESIFNEIELLVELEDLEIYSLLATKIDEGSLMNFPLEYADNPFCWMSLLSYDQKQQDPLTQIMKQKSDTKNNENSLRNTFSIEDLSMIASKSSLSLSCVDCRSTGAKEIPNMFNIVKEKGTIDLIMSLILPFIEEQAVSDEINSIFNHFLKDAKTHCPHNLEYDPNIETPTFKNFSMDCVDLLYVPTLPKTSIGFFTLVIMVVVHIGAVVYPLNIESDNPFEAGDPLSGQKALTIDDDESSKYLNFTNITLQDINVLESMNCQLNKPIQDETSPNSNKVDYFINAFMRGILLDRNTRAFVIEEPDLSLLPKFEEIPLDISDPIVLQGVEFSIKSVKIHGLDSFENIKLAYPLGPQTLHNEIYLRELRVDVNIGIDMSHDDDNNKASEPEIMTLSISLEDLSGSLDLFLPINEDSLLSLQVGSFLDPDQIMPCLLKAVESSVEVTQLSASFGKMKEFGISGFVSKEIEDAIKRSFNGIFSAYGTQVSKAISSTLDKEVRRLVNKSISDFMLSYDDECHDIDHATQHLESSSFIDFRDLLLNPTVATDYGATGKIPYGRLLSMVWEYMELTFAAPGDDGLPVLNEKISAATKLQSNISGALTYDETFVNFSYSIENVADNGYEDTNFTIQASDAEIMNMDSIGYPLELLQPTFDPFVLANELVVGYGPNPLRMALNLWFLFDSDETTTSNDFRFGMNLFNISTAISLLAKVDQKKFMNFPLRNAANPQCWISLIPPPKLDEFGLNSYKMEDRTVRVSLDDFSIGKANFDVECFSCSSPMLETLNNSLLTQDSINLLKRAFTVLSEYITSDNVNQFLEFQLDRQLSEANRLCPHTDDDIDEQITPTTTNEFKQLKSPDSGDKSITIMIIFFASIFSLTFLIISCYFTFRFKLRRQYRGILNALSDDQIATLYKEKVHKENLARDLNACTRSMIGSQRVPKIVRVAVPSVIILNIALFVNSHVYAAGMINMPVNFGGQLNFVRSTYGFSIVQAVKDMWVGGMKPLSLVIIVCSLAWPYIKQTISLFAWCAPTTTLTVENRSTVFHLLDSLGKWSMLDIYTLLMFIAVFKVDVQSPDDLTLFPPGFFNAGLFLEVLWGLYANMLAQILSQISSHIVIYYHREIESEGLRKLRKRSQYNIEPSDTSDTSASYDEASCDSSTNYNKDTPVDESVEALCNHSFKIVSPGSIYPTKGLKISKFLNVFVFIWCLTMLIMLIVGSFVNSFRFEYIGFGGIAIALGTNKETAEVFYSIFGLLDLVVSQGKYVGTTKAIIGMNFLAFLVTTCSIIVPFLLTIALGCMWFIPLNKKRRHRLRVTIEVLQAWQYIEVYVLGVFVAMTQLGSVVDSIVTVYCSELDDLFRQLAHFRIVDERDARCFFLLANLEIGCFLYIGFSVMLLILLTCVSSAMSQQSLDFEKEKDKHNKFLRPEEDSNKNSDKLEDVEDVRQKLSKIPIMFTDVFGFLMVESKT